MACCFGRPPRPVGYFVFFRNTDNRLKSASVMANELPTSWSLMRSPTITPFVK